MSSAERTMTSPNCFSADLASASRSAPIAEVWAVLVDGVPGTSGITIKVPSGNLLIFVRWGLAFSNAASAFFIVASALRPLILNSRDTSSDNSFSPFVTANCICFPF
jgi:hypothetical protein